jgi:flagellar biosynthesis/type III secretory pathway chaperone
MRKPEELLPILDEQLDLLGRRLAVLQGIEDCIGRADLAALEALMRTEAELENDGAALDGRLEELRLALARCSSLPARQITLERVVKALDGPLAIALGDRRERLLVLARCVREQSERTAALVRHALELNQQMLDALTGTAGEGTLYSADGGLRAQSGRNAVRHCV